MDDEKAIQTENGGKPETVKYVLVVQPDRTLKLVLEEDYIKSSGKTK